MTPIDKMSSGDPPPVAQLSSRWYAMKRPFGDQVGPPIDGGEQCASPAGARDGSSVATLPSAVEMVRMLSLSASRSLFPSGDQSSDVFPLTAVSCRIVPVAIVRIQIPSARMVASWRPEGDQSA